MLTIGPITPRTPFDKMFNEAQREVEQVVAEIGNRVFGKPDANFLEYEDRYEVALAVPGLDKSDLDVSVKSRKLIISGKKQKLIESNEAEPEAKGPQYKFREFGFSGFKREFLLPSDARLDDITARCEKGVLTLTVPRVGDSGSLSISIE